MLLLKISVHSSCLNSLCMLATTFLVGANVFEQAGFKVLYLRRYRLWGHLHHFRGNTCGEKSQVLRIHTCSTWTPVEYDLNHLLFRKADD